MVLWANSKPLSLNTSRIGRYVKDSIIFIFGYLLKGVIITVVKKSTLALTVTVAWNSQLTYCYIMSGLKKVSKFANPRQIINGPQMDLMIAKVIKIKSEIQTKALELSVPFGILGIRYSNTVKTSHICQGYLDNVCNKAALSTYSGHGRPRTGSYLCAGECLACNRK